MRALVLEAAGRPLTLQEIPEPRPGRGQVLLRVLACGICRTDLHILDGELAGPSLPLVPGHQIVGEVLDAGDSAGIAVGDRVGVPWLGSTCGHCAQCARGRENLCENAKFTGYTVDGGFAEYACADARYAFSLEPSLDPAKAAPLLCAGLIGYRSLVKAGDARRLGIYGFGAAAHILAQVAVHQGREVFAFTRPGDEEGQRFARSMGATWAGASDETPPALLDAAIIFAPVGALVPAALRAVEAGGTVVCGGIHMSDIPQFPYSILWGERSVVSVANLTRQDGREFLDLAARIPVRTSVELFPLERGNEALERLRRGQIEGAGVLVPSLSAPGAREPE